MALNDGFDDADKENNPVEGDQTGDGVVKEINPDQPDAKSDPLTESISAAINALKADLEKRNIEILTEGEENHDFALADRVDALIFKFEAYIFQFEVFKSDKDAAFVMTSTVRIASMPNMPGKALLKETYPIQGFDSARLSKDIVTTFQNNIR